MKANMKSLKVIESVGLKGRYFSFHIVSVKPFLKLEVIVQPCVCM